MKKKIEITMIALAVTLFLVIVMSEFFSTEFSVTREKALSCSPSTALSILEKPATWPEWAYWSSRMDEKAKFEFDGPEKGIGAIYSWEGPKMGVGKIRIDTIIGGDQLFFTLIGDEGRFEMDGRIMLEQTSEGTRVVWTQTGEVSKDPLQKYIAFFSAEKHLTRHLDECLSGLSAYCTP